jgi:flagellar basal body-associated protein FliL
MRMIRFCLGLVAVLGTAAPAWADDPKEQKRPEHKVTQSKSYLEIDPLYTTIVDDNRPGGMLMVGIGLDVPDAALRDEVTRSLPVLRDAYLRNLMAFTASAVRTDAQPDVGTIADRLQAVTDRALKKKGARILLAQVALRVTSH